MMTDFSQAIRGVKAGARYTRVAWENAMFDPYLYLRQDKILMVISENAAVPYTPDQPDYLAQDWYELPQISDQPEGRKRMKYQHKNPDQVTDKIVTAHQIHTIREKDGLFLVVTGELGQPEFPLTNDQAKKAKLSGVHLGDYYVQTHTGYEYIASKASFEGAYEPLTEVL